jgi:hypothetical protein
MRPKQSINFLVPCIMCHKLINSHSNKLCCSKECRVKYFQIKSLKGHTNNGKRFWLNVAINRV